MFAFIFESVAGATATETTSNVDTMKEASVGTDKNLS